MSVPSALMPPIPPITPERFCKTSFDYLIIGGGTAGLVLAARLSEDLAITVGVVEAGPAAFDEPSIDIPGRFGEALGSKWDWQYETTPQAGIGGRRLPWPRGKVLGGTSALNFMTWNRACREDYDAWEELGNEGWGWDGLLAYFKKSESFTAPSESHQRDHSLHFSPESHGTNGPIKAVHSGEFAPTHQYWHSTLNKLGVETSRDHCAGSNVGVWTAITSVDPDDRTRCYSASAYYKPNISRPNLHVLTEATVKEVILEEDKDGLLATGARFEVDGKTYTVNAGEVILSGGSVASPQLLELSGIGNPDILRTAGITVRVNNPNVGENLQEHMMTATIYEVDPSIVTLDDIRANPGLAAAAEDGYRTSQSGILTTIPSSIAYLPVSKIIPDSDLSSLRSEIPKVNDLRSTILARRFSPNTNLGQVEFNFDTSNYSPYFKASPGKKYATMLQMLQYPFTKGSTHIPPSASPRSKPTTSNDRPIIDPKYYTSEGGDVDVAVMVAGQKFADKIRRTAPLSSIIRQRVFPPERAVLEGKGGEKVEEDDDALFTSYVRNYTITDWHPVGTCAMGGKEGIASGVVDSRLRVYGVRALRVCDASIMPLQISAHIQATVYAIAEKGAALILDDRRGRT
ncbi:MAG: hypothetical protein M1818_005649 [Claussenomyces sp. TS43310]|nr:MAG: hypothetical protein M1818_005649 [Claussenomyces sp. TS43310]